MSITELSIKRPILFIVFYIVLVGLGIFSYSALRYELLPNIAAPFVTVSTVYPGASPNTVEETVTKKLEDGLASVSKVKKMTSNSSENISIITLEFNQDANEDDATQNAQRAVNQVLSELPKDCKTPTVEKFNVNDLPVLVLSATTQKSNKDFRKFINDQIKPRLARIPNIGRITLKGGEEKEIKIALNKGKINAIGLSTMQVVQALSQNNLNIPAGSVEQASQKISLRLDGKFKSIDEIKALVISESKDNSRITLSDIASVSLGNKETTSINRLNQENSIGISIQKQSGSNAVELSKKVRAELTAIETEFKNQNLKFEIAQDSSEYTIKAAKTVYKDFFIAILLVALIMLVFLHSMRNALIVMIAIPTSLVSAFIMMYVMDFTLNIMTLLAMSLVIGILVDDSIVVLENIYRHLEMGKTKEKAALEGRNEIGFAALSITLVDVVVFLPLVFVPGITGSLVQGFSLVVVVSTLTSLLVSFTLTPMLASRFAKLEHISTTTLWGKIITKIDAFLDGFTNKYISVLKWSLRHRFATIMISVLLLFSSFALVVFGYVGGEFVPQADKGEASIAITLPSGNNISETNAIVSKFESKIAQIPEIKSMATSIGDKSDGLNTTIGSNVATINIICIPATAREKSIKDIARDIRVVANTFPGMQVQISPIGMIGAEATPILIVASGKDRDTVLKTAEIVKNTISTIEGAIYPRISTELGKPEIDFKIDRLKLANLGLNYENIGATLRTAVNGFDDLKTTLNGDEYDIRIQLENAEKLSINDLKNISFINDRGNKILLNQFADVNIIASPSNLERRNKSNCVIIASQVIGKSSGDVGVQIQAKLEKTKLPKGVTLSYEGDLELQGDSFAMLGLAFLMSILLVYLNMVVLYNNWLYPFIILFSIPVAIVGALYALALAGSSLNLFSIFGMIMLQGLVAKNAILLVDRANHLREKENRSIMYALLEAGKSRLRPILMTTLAMVIGLLPLALDNGSGSELNKPMAWVLIGGLSSSMFLTLVLVPAIYVQIVNFSEKFSVKKTIKITNSVFTWLIAFSLLFASQSSFSQNKLSLKEAVELGLKNNENIKIATIENQLSKSKIDEAISFLYPNLSFNGTYRRNFKPTVFFIPGEDGTLQATPVEAKNAYLGNLNLSMPLFDAELYKNIAITKKGKEITELQKNQILNELELQIKKLYVEILLSNENIENQNQTLIRNKKILIETKNLLAKGFNTPVDTLKVHIEVKNIENEILKSKNQVKILKLNLQKLISYDNDFEVIPFDFENSNSENIEINLANRTDSKIVKVTNDIAVLEEEKAKALYYPKVYFFGQYQRQAQADDFKFNQYTWPENYFLGVEIKIPLFAGFYNKTKNQQAKILKEQAIIKQSQADKNALLDVTMAKNEIENAELRIVNAQNTLKAANRSFELTNQQYKSGLIKYGDLLDSELTLKQANQAIISAKYELWLAKFNFEKTIK
ncbi:MAG: efflux RND transporter permease subunit [Flavobacterium sp.]|uniref:efflux RND transporter permease subunit n=1 Tax=Flavobacterium sp. TaxID=239 RepID=UPI0022BCD72B|nr:efflux RND transporter permease subunit [Flavobacterium sp.]MCZ8330645.1 efflux RND transporter permease subunit [Flavobacterium sp.]